MLPESREAQSPPAYGRGGLEAEFARFFEENYDHLLNWTAKKLTSPEDAQEITSAVFTSLWYRWLEHGPPDVPEAYLFRVARNKLADHWKAAARRTPTVPLEYADGSDAVADVDRLSEVEALEEYWQFLAMLPSRQRVVLELHVTGLRVSEIAQKLGLSEGGVSNQLHNARTRMAELMGLDSVSPSRATPRGGGRSR